MPASRKRRTLRTVLIVLSLVLVLCVGIPVGGFFLYLQFRQPDELSQLMDGAPKTEVNRYVQDLIDRNYPSAHSRICREDRATTDQAFYTEAAQRSFDVESYEHIKASVASSNATREVISVGYLIQLRLRDGSSREHGFELVPEDGTWRICRGSHKRAQ